MLYEPTRAECEADEAVGVLCECSDAHFGFVLGVDAECPECGATDSDAAECRTCGEHWVLTEGEVECPRCREVARVGREAFDVITAALMRGKAIHIEPRERHDGARSGPFPASCVWVDGVAVPFGPGTDCNWPRALTLAAKTRRAG